MFQSWIGIFATYSYMDDQSFIVIELFLVRNGEERRDKQRGREHCVLHSPNNASSFSSDRNRLQRNFCKPSTIFQTHNLAMAFCETSFIPATCCEQALIARYQLQSSHSTTCCKARSTNIWLLVIS